MKNQIERSSLQPVDYFHQTLRVLISDADKINRYIGVALGKLGRVEDRISLRRFSQSCQIFSADDIYWWFATFRLGLPNLS